MDYHEAKKTKKERRAEASSIATRKQKIKSLRSVLTWVIPIVLAIAGYSFVVSKFRVSPQGDYTASQGSQHIAPGTNNKDYTTNPPTSGSHLAGAAAWGIYDKVLPDEQLVHNLEHGGIWISYKKLDDESLDRLKEFTNKHSESVVLTPRADNNLNIALASWERLEEMEVLDMETVELFYKGNKNKSPEPLAGR